MFTRYGKPFIFIVLVCLAFFYKTLLFGLVPFPGDLLLTQYGPWRHVSYNGYIAGSIPSKDQYFDVIRELYPWRTQVIKSIKQHSIPLWNPHNGSGTPLLANYQSQVFYPLSILYYIFPQSIAWTIMTILQPILGIFFVYLFATQIGLSVTAALLVGILFCFGSFATVWMEFTTIVHTIIWLPLLLYLVEKQVQQKGINRSQKVLFIFSLFCAITAGHPQDFITVFIFLCIYITARQAWSMWFLVIAPFFLASMQLLPTIELFKNSARMTHDYQTVIESMLIQLPQLPLLLHPDFFGNPATRTNLLGDYVGKTMSVGVIGFFLAFAAIWTKPWSMHKRFFAISTIAILLLTVRTPISELFYRYPIPILSTGNPTRILFLLTFALSILAGFGFDSLTNSSKKHVSIFVSMATIIIALFLFAPIKRVMVISCVTFLALSTAIFLSRYKKIYAIAVIFLCIGELWYSFLKFNPFVPSSFIFPPSGLNTYLKEHTGIYRYWGYGTAEIEANFATQIGVYSTDNTDPLNLRWYNQLIQASYDGNLARTFTRQTRSDAQLAPGYGETDLAQNMYRLRLMDVLGVKYIIDRDENPKTKDTFPPDRFKEVHHEDNWTVYENLKVAPRFFTTNDVRPYLEINDFENQFFGPTYTPDKTVLVQEKTFGTLPYFTASTSTNKLISYQPGRVEIQSESTNPQFLFLSDTYDQGWRVSVNGKPSTVIRSNYAFQGVVIPAGKSTVVFSYLPRSFETGVAISGIALICTIIYLSVPYNTIHNQNKKRDKTRH